MSENKPRVNSASQREIDKTAAQFDQFEKDVKDLTLDRMNAEGKKEETEPQTKLSQKEIENSREIRLVPKKRQTSVEKFNEKFREDFRFQSEYVQFIAENNELIGATIEVWTKAFPGQDAEYWEVPVNKPIWGPRYLAEQLRKASYHVLSMHESMGSTGGDHLAQYTGKMVVDTIKQRLNANPVNSSRKSIFMGASGF